MQNYLKTNPDKIDWECLSKNPSIFLFDYKQQNHNLIF